MVPFGFTNAFATFMFLMNNAFSKYLDNFMMVFLDDILVYSKDEAEHDYHLRLVLKVLWKDQLYSKINKFTFFQDKVKYLAHIIFEEGIAVDL